MDRRPRRPPDEKHAMTMTARRSRGRISMKAPTISAGPGDVVQQRVYSPRHDPPGEIWVWRAGRIRRWWFTVIGKVRRG